VNREQRTENSERVTSGGDADGDDDDDVTDRRP
jgi:hypothetical protein